MGCSGLLAGSRWMSCELPAAGLSCGSRCFHLRPFVSLGVTPFSQRDSGALRGDDNYSVRGGTLRRRGFLFLPG